MKVPEQYRVTKGLMATDASYGNNGIFIIPFSNRTFANIIATAIVTGKQIGRAHV